MACSSCGQTHPEGRHLRGEPYDAVKMVRNHKPTISETMTSPPQIHISTYTLYKKSLKNIALSINRDYLQWWGLPPMMGITSIERDYLQWEGLPPMMWSTTNMGNYLQRLGVRPPMKRVNFKNLQWEDYLQWEALPPCVVEYLHEKDYLLRNGLQYLQ